MEKITMKAFKEGLINNKSQLVDVLRLKESLTDSLLNRLEKDISKLPSTIQREFRQVAKVQSNALKFNNDSWLYFDQIAEKNYYKLNDYIIMIL